MLADPVWYNDEKTAIYLRCEGSWTWAEYEHAMSQVYALADAIQHPYSLIVHVVDHAAAKAPSGAFTHWSQSMSDMNRLSKLILVSDIYMVRLFGNISQRVFSRDKARKVHSVDTLETAEALMDDTYSENTRYAGVAAK